LKNRSAVVICWELLKALSFGPQGPSRLARVANVPFDRLGEYMNPMLANGLVTRESPEGHELYHITQEGMSALGDLDRVLPKLAP
jgi:predicted transcriptional regulator